MASRARLPGLVLLLGLGACAARPDVDGQRMHARVVHQVEAGPRIPGTPGHAAVHAWLIAELKRLGARVESQDFTDSAAGRALQLRNVIARFGAGKKRPLVLCAHWDTRPWCDHDPDSTAWNEPLPGANDGASGVAVLLEIAELMSRRAPPRPVELVFFDGEDQGPTTRPEEYCLGSKAYAASLSTRAAEDRPIAAILFDMVGDRSLEIFPEVQSAKRAANVVSEVLEAARRTGGTSFRIEPHYELIDDHLALLDAGVPAVDVIDFDYPAWHTRADRPDQVSATSLAEVARVAAWIVYRSSLART